MFVERFSRGVEDAQAYIEENPDYFSGGRRQEPQDRGCVGRRRNAVDQLGPVDRRRSALDRPRSGVRHLGRRCRRRSRRLPVIARRSPRHRARQSRRARFEHRVVVNGSVHELPARPDETLLEVLREGLGLTRHEGVVRPGSVRPRVHGARSPRQPVLSCVSLVSLVEGAVTTVEGLEEESRDLRARLADLGGFQCGYCASGMVVVGTALLRRAAPGATTRCAGRSPATCAGCARLRRDRRGHPGRGRPRGIASARHDVGRRPGAGDRLGGPDDGTDALLRRSAAGGSPARVRPPSPAPVRRGAHRAGRRPALRLPGSTPW